MKLIILGLLLTLVIPCHAQNFTTGDIKQIVENKYVAFDTSKHCVFILRGEVFEEKVANEELKKYPAKNLRFIEAYGTIAYPTTTRIFHGSENDWMILIDLATKQKKRDIRKVITELKANLNKYVSPLVIRDVSSKAKLVLVNGKILGEQVSKNYVNKLKIKEIEFVSISESPNPAFYGNRAANGSVEIYLKK
ncbi:MAG: TonB-dependent receptor plug domain-containing protein [Verrucomicrobia bacterium]|nr:TonB-dependent receptor plug domain-containing protein [Cytophagales bacterium]